MATMHEALVYVGTATATLVPFIGCSTPQGAPQPPAGRMTDGQPQGANTNPTLQGYLDAKGPFTTPTTEQMPLDEDGGGYSLPWITPRYPHGSPPPGLETIVDQVYQATEKLQDNAPDSYSTVTVASPDGLLQTTFGPQLVFSSSGSSVRWVGLNGGLHLVVDGRLEISTTDGTQSIVTRSLPAEETLLKVENAISQQIGFDLAEGEVGAKIMEQTLRPGMTFGDFAQESATAKTQTEWRNIYYKYFGSVTLFDPMQGTQATKNFEKPSTTAQSSTDALGNSIEDHLPVVQVSQKLTVTPSSTKQPTATQTSLPASPTPQATQVAQVVEPTPVPTDVPVEPTQEPTNEVAQPPVQKGRFIGEDGKVHATLTLNYGHDNQGPLWGKLPVDANGNFLTGDVVRFPDTSLGGHQGGFSAVIEASPFKKDGHTLLPLVMDSPNGPIHIYLDIGEWAGGFYGVPNGVWGNESFTRTDYTTQTNVMVPGTQIGVIILGTGTNIPANTPGADVISGLINQWGGQNDALINDAAQLENGQTIHIPINLAVPVRP